MKVNCFEYSRLFKRWLTPVDVAILLNNDKIYNILYHRYGGSSNLPLEDKVYLDIIREHVSASYF